MAVISSQPPVQPKVDLTGISPEILYRTQPWYEAYMAALFEANHQHMIEKIRWAERLMISREREMLSQEASALERSALDKAFHALRALEFCHKLLTNQEVRPKLDE